MPALNYISHDRRCRAARGDLGNASRGSAGAPAGLHADPPLDGLLPATLRRGGALRHPPKSLTVPPSPRWLKILPTGSNAGRLAACPPSSLLIGHSVWRRKTSHPGFGGKSYPRGGKARQQPPPQRPPQAPREGPGL